MSFLEVIFEIADLFVSWRFYVCAIPVILVAVVVQNAWPNSAWPWFFTVPLV